MSDDDLLLEDELLTLDGDSEDWWKNTTVEQSVNPIDRVRSVFRAIEVELRDRARIVAEYKAAAAQDELLLPIYEKERTRLMQMVKDNQKLVECGRSLIRMPSPKVRL